MVSQQLYENSSSGEIQDIACEFLSFEFRNDDMMYQSNRIKNLEKLVEIFRAFRQI